MELPPAPNAAIPDFVDPNHIGGVWKKRGLIFTPECAAVNRAIYRLDYNSGVRSEPAIMPQKSCIADSA